jgi:hypothetical protein
MLSYIRVKATAKRILEAIFMSVDGPTGIEKKAGMEVGLQWFWSGQPLFWSAIPSQSHTAILTRKSASPFKQILAESLELRGVGAELHNPLKLP